MTISPFPPLSGVSCAFPAPERLATRRPPAQTSSSFVLTFTSKVLLYNIKHALDVVRGPPTRRQRYNRSRETDAGIASIREPDHADLLQIPRPGSAADGRRRPNGDA